MQVLQPFFKTLHNLNTLSGWSKGYDIFCAKLANFENRNFLLATFWWLKLKTYPGVDASFYFSKLRQEVNAQCRCL